MICFIFQGGLHMHTVPQNNHKFTINNKFHCCKTLIFTHPLVYKFLCSLIFMGHPVHHNSIYDRKQKVITNNEVAHEAGKNNNPSPATIWRFWWLQGAGSIFQVKFLSGIFINIGKFQKVDMTILVNISFL